MEWLPQINGFGIGVILAAVLEVGKLFGLHEDDTGKVALALGVLWAAVALVAQEYPATTSWVTMVFQILLAVAAVPIGAKVAYKGVVEPANNQAWNREK
jgi:hypothetical protein